MPDFSALPTDQLIERLRKAAAIWLKNDDLLLLEELIRRATIKITRKERPPFDYSRLNEEGE